MHNYRVIYFTLIYYLNQNSAETIHSQRLIIQEFNSQKFTIINFFFSATVKFCYITKISMYLLLRDVKTNKIKVVFIRDNNAYN